MKQAIILFLSCLFSVTVIACSSKIKSTKSETYTVYGMCNQCKDRIEKAVFQKRKAIGTWNVDTKKLTLTFDSIKTNSKEILKLVAYAGHDNDLYMAPDEAYNKLDECCKYKRMYLKEATPPKEIKTEIKKAESVNPVVSTATPVQKNEPLTDVYAAYFGIKDALTKDDGTTAAAKAKELYNAVDKVKMESMTVAQHTVWMKNMQAISYNAEHIKGTTDNEHQREHFAKLSAAMIEVMKVIKPNYEIYIDHCPMYNNGKGADWLSKESGIKNPYYGLQMLSCGSTKEAIK